MKPGLREIVTGTVLALGCSSDLSAPREITFSEYWGPIVESEKARRAMATPLEICRQRIEALIGAFESPTGMWRESSLEKLRMEREKCLREHNLPEDSSL